MSAKQAINDKLQGSVALYLRCGGVVNINININIYYFWQPKAGLSPHAHANT